MDNQINKISFLREIRKNKDLKFEIEIDGGINKENASICIEKGADVLIAGSYIFGSLNNDYKELIESLRKWIVTSYVYLLIITEDYKFLEIFFIMKLKTGIINLWLNFLILYMLAIYIYGISKKT